MFNRLLILALMASLLFACTEKPDSRIDNSADKLAPAVDQSQAEIKDGIKRPGLANGQHQTAKPLTKEIALPIETPITISVAKPAEQEMSSEERDRLGVEKDKIEASMQEILQQYDQNLDDPEKRKELEARLRQESAAYKEKVLSLVKDGLKEEKR